MTQKGALMCTHTRIGTHISIPIIRLTYEIVYQDIGKMREVFSEHMYI